jgi:hypothetical protein
LSLLQAARMLTTPVSTIKGFSHLYTFNFI